MVERITSNNWSYDKVLSSILSMCILKLINNYAADIRNRFGQFKLCFAPRLMSYMCGFSHAKTFTKMPHNPV